MSEQVLPSHVMTEIDSPIRESRLTAVDELSRLAFGADLAMAAAARRELQRLTDDDSRSVASAAARALERTAIRLNPDSLDFGQIAPGTPRLVADVLVEGPPLAVAAATVTVSGPGLRAMLTGRQLRVVWLPRTDWLDGSVTVRGPAGWADVRVTGQVTEAAPVPRSVAEAYESTTSGVRGLRMTVLPPTPPPRSRRRLGATALVGGLTALVLLGGAGVAVAFTMNRPPSAPAAVQGIGPTPAPSTFKGQALTTPGPAQVPLANRIRSVDKPTIAATVRVGAEPEGVVVSPDGSTVYIANQSSHVLSVMDAQTRQVSSIQLRNTPRFVAVSRDGKLVFVSMYEDLLDGSGVAVVDTASRKVLRNLDTGVQPYALSVGPDGRLWVPIHSKGNIEVYDATGTRRDAKITVVANPHAVGFSGDLMRAFTPNHESNVVSVIDMRADKVLKTIPVSKAPHSLAVSPDGRRVIVAGYEANATNLIDALTLKRGDPVKVGTEPQSVAFAADGEHAYVVNEGDNTVSVLNGRTGKVTSTVKVGRSPRTVGVSPDGRFAYVSNGDDNTVSVLKVGA
ncbi:beta-propeller fold lactonase family protein [Actinoplanes sp. TBRC 11911]|uniref:YVTN family beta-propeller repeat protein n=1 Tax=Actinoplanes sp. TBRC 11911 TaxID=2729386 RepID=UPI00145C4DC0|nr:beta-propeller fold lactonase family protein [Actinoplanes sp. TBRC 11911]NMO50745.1 beta-propeller fold lactonase family protein [Actinoplanes sp. TBRC 11911]